jgi:hypothetical protein
MSKSSKFERGSVGRWTMAMLIAAFAFSSSVSNSFATTIEACQNRDGKIRVIKPESSRGPDTCGPNQTLLTWNIAGPQGPSGPAGATGQAGSAGPSGPLGPVGSAGSQGVKGDKGDVGPAGPAGATGSTGATGATGATGTTGTTGATGASGSNSVLLFGGTQTNVMDVTNPTYMGPGNGYIVTPVPATGTQTVGVPMPIVGILYNLQVYVQTGPALVTDSWTFNVCVNEDCGAGVQCTITGSLVGPVPTSCSDTIDFAFLAAGDRVTIQAVPANGSTLMPPTPASFSTSYATQSPP